MDRCSCFIDKEYEIGGGIANAYLSLSHVEIVTFDGMLSFVKEHLINIGGMKKIFPEEGITDALNRAIS